MNRIAGMHRGMCKLSPHGYGIGIGASDLIEGTAGNHGIRVCGAEQSERSRIRLRVQVRSFTVLSVHSQQRDSAGNSGLQGCIVNPDSVLQIGADFRPGIAPAAKGGAVCPGFRLRPQARIIGFDMNRSPVALNLNLSGGFPCLRLFEENDRREMQPVDSRRFGFDAGAFGLRRGVGINSVPLAVIRFNLCILLFRILIAFLLGCIAGVRNLLQFCLPFCFMGSHRLLRSFLILI